jgi:S-adenosylmethionine:tRNA ribosyltransferase-isomerase
VFTNKKVVPHPLHRVTDFPEVPQELIPQQPLAQRDEARLMVLDRQHDELRHQIFRDLDQLMTPGDVLVVNDVKVFPARLFGRKATGGQVKVLLLKRLERGPSVERWTCLLTPPLRIGASVNFGQGLSGVVKTVHESGEFEIEFSQPITENLSSLGRMPLPPYIRRDTADTPEVEQSDRQFYQTVYAKDVPADPSGPAGPWMPGAVTAPTAGLHFTPELLERIRARGVEIAPIALKVGWGTFRPLRDDDYRNHQMLSEEYHVTEAAAEAINRVRRSAGRVWAVGTSVTRALETVADDSGLVKAGSGETSLYIYPGYAFRAVDALITNFHLPRHTPLLLAAAFAGTDKLRQAYEVAVKEGYRFFSYGDAMAIL